MTAEIIPMGRKQKTNGKLQLTAEERLELQNIDLRRQVLEAQLEKETSKLEVAQIKIIAKVKKRTKKDLEDYKVNMTTGECTPKEAPNEETA